MTAENRIGLLWNCATALKPATHTHRLLKSYYINICRRTVKYTIQIPKEKISTAQMCSRCGCFWSESEFQMKLKSQHVTMNEKTKKLIAKLDKSRETGQRGLLSGKQRKRAKWLEKRATQYMELKCGQCQYKSAIKMEKPKMKAKETDVEIEVQKEELESEPPVKAKRKKKNKNKLAGLKLPVDAEPNTEEVKKNIKRKIPQQPPTQTPKTAVTPNKSKLEQGTNAKKKKKSTKAASNPPSKVNVSKTQKQNSILQLAALLKQQSSSSSSADGTNVAQKRLESLLK